MWFIPNLPLQKPLPSPSSPAMQASSQAASHAPALLYWPGASESTYEALDEVAIHLGYHLRIADGLVSDLLDTRCPLPRGFYTPLSLAEAAGNALPGIWVRVHVSTRTIDVTRESSGGSSPTRADANSSPPIGTEHLQKVSPISTAITDNHGVTRRTEEIDPVRMALRPLMRQVTLSRGNLQSVAKQLAAASGFSVLVEPDIPMGTIGDGIPWGRPQPVLGILRTLGKQSYLLVRIHPYTQRVVIRIQES